MNDARSLNAFLKDYDRYALQVLEPTYREITAILAPWKQPDYWAHTHNRSRLPDPSPVQRFSVRIKRPESVVDKIKRRPKNFPDGLSPKSFQLMTDALGVRVVVYFLSQLPLIDRELRRLKSVDLSREHPPLAYLPHDVLERLSLGDMVRRDKASGYTSLHYVLRLPESSVPNERRPSFELQVRTLAQELWAEIEHILGYKPQKRTLFPVTRQFQTIGKSLGAIDDQLNFLYEEQARFQEEVEYKDTDPMNPENLPVVLSEHGIGCAQSEIDGLLKLLFSRGIHNVGLFKATATPDRVERIRNTYRATLGRPPINFEVIATLATLRDARSGSEEVPLIKAQISYLDAWDALKRRLGSPTAIRSSRRRPALRKKKRQASPLSARQKR